MNALNNTLRRSWIVVPAHKAALVDEAARSGADVVVLDLFELVTDRNRQAARDAMPVAIEAARSGGAEVFAQIGPAAVDSDAAAVLWPGLSGIVLARSDSARQIAAAAETIEPLELERGVARGSVRIVAALETAAGNHAAYEILRASARVWGATLGRADLVMDLRPGPSGEIHLMPYLMQRLVIVARAAGVTPIGAWWRAPDRGLLATAENTYEAARRGRAIGFKGAMCLRAEQVDGLNRGFSRT